MSVKVLELFAGIGACSKALERLGIDHEIVDAVEIDKYAIKSFNAIHGTSFEPQDITKWDKSIQVDLIMHGSPCQDFSIAGKQAGGDKDSGTRSSLMYETLRIVEKLKPRFVIWENVRNVISQKHRHNYFAYIEEMAKLGYKNYGQILNAKDYNVPQNRQRVFTVSIRERERQFEFPKPVELERKLGDMLEENVDEKFFLNDDQLAGLLASNYDQNKRFYDTNGCSPTISTMGGGQRQPKIVEPFVVASRGRGEKGNTNQHLEPRRDGTINTLTSVQKDNYIAMPETAYCIDAHYHKGTTLKDYLAKHRRQLVPIKTATKKGYDLAKEGDGIDLGYPESNTRRGRHGHDVAKTLTCSDSQGTLAGTRIRKLTPKECWRLMGFDDADFEKAKASGISDSQLYKQAGNSIVVNVLEGILRNLLYESVPNPKN